MANETIRFWTYLVLMIPSSICTLVILYCFLFDRTLRRSLITIYPWMMYYYRSSGIWHRTPAFCGLWRFIDWGLYTTHTILFAWATIERHILIFHHRWMNTQMRRILLHYLPTVVTILYCFIFYITILFLLPCPNYYYDFVLMCMQPCYIQNRLIEMWDTIGNQIIPYVIIMVFSVTLVLRVLRQKHRLHQPIEWRRYRKMTIQLLSISLLYLIFFFPLTLYKTLEKAHLHYIFPLDFRSYAIFLSYLVVLLFSFVCALCFSELRKVFGHVLSCHHRFRTIFPETRTKRDLPHRIPDRY